HNPNSNMKLGSGVMDLPGLMKKGGAIALGTDGAASNNRLDL
ncbi:MAG: amidohydrolase family protein, partial [Synergistaceae bacterium]|nr:amidohydrolase family protein [Synergistaceae bacterium]